MSKKTEFHGMAILEGLVEKAITVAKKQVAKFRNGLELVDGRAMEPPLGYEPSESLHEMINRAVRDRAIQQAIADAGGETFEESEDFDVGDDLDPTSPYEAFFEPISEAEFDRLTRAGYKFYDGPEPPAKPPSGVQGAEPPVPSPAPQAPPAPAKAP